MTKIVIDQKIQGVVSSKDGFEKGEYESCTFTNCDLSEANMTGCNFVDCVFDQCNLSNAKLKNTSLQTVHFKGCKILGVNFAECNGFSMSVQFDHCTLNLSSFFKQKLKGTKFRNTSLKEVDFTEADLSAALFEECDLTGATFDASNLEKTDLRSAYHYSIDPEKNKIKKAKFSKEGIAGLLDKYQIDIS